MIEERCEVTDLLPSMCAHCLNHGAPSKPRATGTTIDARFDGLCRCGCRERYQAGDSITHSTDADGWCKTEHVEPAS